MPGARLATLLIALTAGACSSGGGGSVRERLDPQTATTVTLLAHPVELIATTPSAMSAPGARAGNSGSAPEPFAFLAPFETDRSGQRELFLWVAPPAGAGAAGQAQLTCDDAPVAMTPVSAELGSLGLSQAPYAAPTPWADAWYYRIPDDAMRCLAQAHAIVLQLQSAAGMPVRFSAQSSHLAGLEAFERR